MVGSLRERSPPRATAPAAKKEETMLRERESKRDKERVREAFSLALSGSHTGWWVGFEFSAWGSVSVKALFYVLRVGVLLQFR